MAEDPWSLDNPSGYINLGTAENHLLFDLLEPRLTAPRSITAADTHYQELAGSPSLRTALAAFLARRVFQTEVDPDDLVVLAGAGVALEVLAFALCEPGDGIVVPAPYFSGVDGALTGRTRAVIIPAPLDPANGFALTAEAVEQAILQADVPVRAVALLSPSNPLGHLYDEQTLRAIAEVTLKHGLHLIVDEIYALSVHHGEFFSCGQLAPSDRIHLIWGFAKDFALSGYKVGVLHTRNPDIRAAAQSQARLATPSSDTQVLLRDLISDEPWVDSSLKTARTRLLAAYDLTTTALTAAGIPYLPAQAGLFLYLDLRTFEPEPARIFTEAKLNLTPGTSFHTAEPGWFRLCYATHPAAVTTAITRLAAVLEG
ncbi:pyridoxal phosphate-dependent aminotransferase [Kribbella sancticallisti]|uniref:Pyridoxal phosphate-dependent aminotransferase n=2 Tax=Kribbella sancticallisti TaxID=460087 RepID=A0ABP4Q9Y2_9ACTN